MAPKTFKSGSQPTLLKKSFRVLPNTTVNHKFYTCHKSNSTNVATTHQCSLQNQHAKLKKACQPCDKPPSNPSYNQHTIIHCKQPARLFTNKRFVAALLLSLLALSQCAIYYSHCSDLSKTIDPEDLDIDDCSVCKMLVDSFDKGLDRTARGKHEGGDASWEERNLRKYPDSEIRLSEIQERLCEDAIKAKPKCLSMLELSDSYIEDWWFGERLENVRLHDYLCISKLKVCCPINSWGPTCKSCQNDCSKRGRCDGSGTRSGSGKCNCFVGHKGSKCEDCTSDHYRIDLNSPDIDKGDVVIQEQNNEQDESGAKFLCWPCDQACDGCYGEGASNCTSCKSGYYTRQGQAECVDIDECDTDSGKKMPCPDGKYCINTQGSFRCADCHPACSKCNGDDASMCISCAPNHSFDANDVCRPDGDSDEDGDLSVIDMISGSLSFDDDHWMLSDPQAKELMYYLFLLLIPLMFVFVRTNQPMWTFAIVSMFIMFIIYEYIVALLWSYPFSTRS